MKRIAIVLPFVLALLLLCSCGDVSTTTQTHATAATPEPTPEPLSKEQMLEQAFEVSMYTIRKDFHSNMLKAKTTYTDTILLLDGMVTEITGEYITLGEMLLGNYVYVEACIPVEEQMELEVGQRVIIVGKTEQDIREEEGVSLGSTTTVRYLHMSDAYLVQDRFEFRGHVFHYLGYTSFNVHVPPTNDKATSITFADGVDTTVIDKNLSGATLNLRAKLFPLYSEGYYRYEEAEILG